MLWSHECKSHAMPSAQHFTTFSPSSGTFCPLFLGVPRASLGWGSFKDVPVLKIAPSPILSILTSYAIMTNYASLHWFLRAESIFLYPQCSDHIYQQSLSCWQFMSFSSSCFISIVTWQVFFSFIHHLFIMESLQWQFAKYILYGKNCAHSLSK